MCILLRFFSPLSLLNLLAISFALSSVNQRTHSTLNGSCNSASKQASHQTNARIFFPPQFLSSFSIIICFCAYFEFSTVTIHYYAYFYAYNYISIFARLLAHIGPLSFIVHWCMERKNNNNDTIVAILLQDMKRRRKRQQRTHSDM